MVIKKNDKIKLDIESVTLQGSGVGKVDGMTVFVPSAAPGDRVITHIIKVKSSYAVGKIDKILKESPVRIKSDCLVSTPCGGCVFRHISYEEELKIKREQVKNNFLRLAHMDIEIEQVIGAQNPSNYRNKAQYKIACENGEYKVGFYSQKSHKIVHCTDCKLQPDGFSDILEAVLDWAQTHKVSCYDENTGEGILRNIYVRASEVTGETMVCMVINSHALPFADELRESLVKAAKKLKGFLININKENTNVVLGSETKILWGEGHITDVLCGKMFQISPHSFYQVNRTQAEILYNLAREYAALTKEQTLLDFYCGAGTIGLSMADSVGEVIGVEIVEQAVEDAKKNAKINGIENARFICADASEAARILLSEHITPDVIVLDPPRKGCAPELVDTVCEMNPKRIVYISCDSATLARDSVIFREKGYNIKRLSCVDLFPRTAHVECVVLLSHKSPDSHINMKVEFGEDEGKVPLDGIAERAKGYQSAPKGYL